MTRAAFYSLAVLGSLVVIGCGGGTEVDLPFDKDRPISELTPEELKEACVIGLDALRDAYGYSLCSMQGFIANLSGEGSCEDVRQSCLDNTFDASNCEGGSGQGMECEVTVGEYEKCMNDSLDLARGLPHITCSMTMEELQELSQRNYSFDTPDSCKQIEEKCGDINFGGGTSWD